MLANDRVELLHFQLFRLGALVFSGCVKVACARTGNHLDFVAHGILSYGLNFAAAFANVDKHGINALFINDAQTVAGDPQTDPAFLTLDPKAAFVQIWYENSFSFIVSVRNIVAYNASLARYLAFS